eukprot:4387026-Pyramimonas_sp.AAC.1
MAAGDRRPGSRQEHTFFRQEYPRSTAACTKAISTWSHRATNSPSQPPDSEEASVGSDVGSSPGAAAPEGPEAAADSAAGGGTGGVEL